MKKVLKVLVTTILILTCSFGIFSCKKKVDLNSNLSEYVLAQKQKWYIGENKKLTWYVGLNWWSYTNDWLSYPVLKEVSQITGVVPTVSISQDDSNSQIKLRMANNRLPDLISLSPDDPLIEELVEGGYVYSYDELINRYCSDYVDMATFKSWCSEDFWNATTYESTNKDYDGKIYGLNCFYYDDVEDLGQLTFNVKEDYYEELGKPDMSTETSFYNALKACKTKYPDVYPLALPESWYCWVFEQAFGVLPQYVTDSGVKIRIKDPKFLKAMLFLRKLYNEELIDPDVFSTKDYTTKLAAGKVFCYPVTYWGLDDVNASLGEGKGFISVEPLRGDDIGNDVRFQGTARLGWMTTLISKKCSDPETAIKFAQYMFSKDGNLLVCYGHENEHYTITNDNKIQRTNEVVEARKTNLTKFENETGIFTQRLFNYPYYDEEESQDERTKNNVNMASKYVFDYTVFSYKSTPSSVSNKRLSDISTKIWQKYDTLWSSMVVAKTDSDAQTLLTNALSDMDKLGLSQLETYWTEQYNKNIQRFGIPYGLEDILGE